MIIGTTGGVLAVIALGHGPDDARLMAGAPIIPATNVVVSTEIAMKTEIATLPRGNKVQAISALNSIITPVTATPEAT
jgi:hypothetical protein